MFTTRPLHYPRFDNAFVGFSPYVLVPVEKRIYLFTALGGWSVEEIKLCFIQTNP